MILKLPQEEGRVWYGEEDSDPEPDLFTISVASPFSDVKVGGIIYKEPFQTGSFIEQYVFKIHPCLYMA